MTLRLSPAQTEALRRRAQAERVSMQDVVKRAVEEYLALHDAATPLDLVIDAALDRHGPALQELARWRD
ncbi:MAG: ribbon-helix-helix protein CopG family [Klenkia sp.]|nr:ribbon-helix-helix protein CopG family [Klenkia sp.]